MGWNSVSQEIGPDDQNKWDRKVSAKELLIAENGSLKLLNGYAEIPEFALSDAATAQLCQKLEIPVRYYRKSDPWSVHAEDPRLFELGVYQTPALKIGFEFWVVSLGEFAR